MTASRRHGMPSDPRVTPRRRVSSGFTLLEAIVALAIIGIALIPLLSFMSQAALQLQTVADSNARNLAKQDALAFFETVNPLNQMSGSANVGAYQVSWSSRELVPPNEKIRPGTGLAGYAIGFFDVAVDVRRQNNQPWFAFNLRKVGYRRIDQSGAFGFQQ